MDDKFASRRFPATLVTGSMSLPMRGLMKVRAWRLEAVGVSQDTRAV
jgi:hypothetical protein